MHIIFGFACIGCIESVWKLVARQKQKQSIYTHTHTRANVFTLYIHRSLSGIGCVRAMTVWARRSGGHGSVRTSDHRDFGPKRQVLATVNLKKNVYLPNVFLVLSDADGSDGLLEFSMASDIPEGQSTFGQHWPGCFVIVQSSPSAFTYGHTFR